MGRGNGESKTYIISEGKSQHQNLSVAPREFCGSMFFLFEAASSEHQRRSLTAQGNKKAEKINGYEQSGRT